MTRIPILFATLLLLLGSCRGPAPKLVIISTNDIHSSIDNFPSLVSLVEDYRTRENVSVLLIDAGDRWTGSPYVDMAPEQYKPVIDLMNAAGFDIATFGNHEWDNGNKLLAKRSREAGFRKVLTNADTSHSALENVEAYHVTEVDGLKLGFIGLVTTDVDGHPDGKLENFGGINFFDPLISAELYSGIADSVDLFIAITHIGLTADSLLAVARPEIDLIIGGHSHNIIPVGRDIAGTVVTQTGKNLLYAGVTEVSHRKGRVSRIENRLVMLDTLPPNPDVSAMVEAIKNDPELLKVVGTVSEPMNKIALLNLFSDAMRRTVGADFAFYNMGSMRLDSLPPGDIRKVDVYSAEPFGNTIVTVEMTMEEIAQFILNKFNSTGKESHSLDLYPSGISYTIITDGEGIATDIFFDHSAAPSPGGRFRVALSDYVDSVYKYAYTGQGTQTGIRIATAAEAYISTVSPIIPCSSNRVVIE